ncbi:MAG: FtsX-like permease family protein [Candidatus Cryptobacteroides sp.]
MNLPLFIAGRYLFAKKSHNVINIISAISCIGMAVGTAALVIILSVYNGFEHLVSSMVSDIEPDILVTPAQGKVFIPEGEAFDWMDANDGFSEVCHVLQENVFIDYEDNQGIAVARGVDEGYETDSPLASRIVQGQFSLHKGDLPQMVVGTGVAQRLGINPAFLSSATIYFPARDRNISLSNPASSLESVRMRPSGIFNVNQSASSDLVIIPLEEMRRLLGYEKEISGIEIRLADPGKKALKRARAALEEKLGEDFKVQDRVMQNPSLYKMMRYEKAAVFLILIFVIIIIAFNIFGSLTMLIIEKQEDIGTFRSLGAEDSLVRKIFTLEGWLISLLGLAAGVVVGTVVALLQQHLGLIKIPGNFLVEAYPVILKIQDIGLTVLCVATIGYIMAVIPVKRNMGSPKRNSTSVKG